MTLPFKTAKFIYSLTLDTSRKPAADEKDGEVWHFESEEKMLTDIANHQYLEYGKHEGNLYGTKITSVKSIIQEKRIPILDIETPVCISGFIYNARKAILTGLEEDYE